MQYIYLSVQAVPVPWPGLSPHIRAESRLLAVLRGEAAGAEEEGPVQRHRKLTDYQYWNFLI